MPQERIELVASGIVSLTLVGLGAYYLFREERERRRHEGYRTLPPADQRHYRRQYARRAVGSSLLILAGIAVFVGQGMMDWQSMPRAYLWLWVSVICGLFGIVALAGADLVAIYRYSRRHQQRIEQDKLAMIERQLAHYRAERRRSLEPPPDWSPEQN